MKRTNFARAFEVMYDPQGVVNVSGFRIAYQDAPQQGNKYVDTFFILLYISYAHKLCTQVILTE
jgi:hypothetical protein